MCLGSSLGHDLTEIESKRDVFEKHFGDQQGAFYMQMTPYDKNLLFIIFDRQ